MLYRIKDEQDNPEKQSRRKQNHSYLLARIKKVWVADFTTSRQKQAGSIPPLSLTYLSVSLSVGTTGDSYDNALAESVNGLYKTEVIDYFKHEWEGVKDVALATLDWVHWYNHERLHSTNEYLSPVEAENIYYRSLNRSSYAA
ncbi:integrase core domain-containing protein [Acinetobacter sp. c3-l95]|uniref:integrase core domain-containing protein n=1 Tax=Acinetobacter sp. c3-l95 TaxID=3342804 RepID=UPI0035B9409C